MPRLFTGLEIPSDVAQSLAVLRGGLPGARWIDPENYHVTLRFIGDVDDVIAHEVASLLGRVGRRRALCGRAGVCAASVSAGVSAGGVSERVALTPVSAASTARRTWLWRSRGRRQEFRA